MNTTGWLFKDNTIQIKYMEYKTNYIYIYEVEKTNYILCKYYLHI